MASTGITQAAITAMMISATLTGATAEETADNCSAASEAARYVAEIIQAAQASAADDSTTRKDRLKAQIFAAAATTDEDSEAATALISLLSRCERTRRNEARQAQLDIQKLQIELAHALGVSEALDALKDATIDGTGSMTTISGTARFKQIKLADNAHGIPATHCNIAELLRTPTKLANEPSRAKKRLDPQTLAQVTTPAAADAELAMCCVANSGNTKCTESGSADMGIKGHKLFKAQPAAGTSTRKLDPQNRAATSVIASTAVHADKLLHAEEALQAMAGRTHSKAGTCTPHSHINDPNFQHDVRTILLKKPARETYNEQETTEITNKIKAVYGTDEAGYQNGLKKRIQETKATAAYASTAQATEIKAINDEAILEDMLAVASARRAARHSSNTKCPSDNSDPRKEESTSCKNKTKKEECHDPCEWKGTETDGKCETKGGEEGLKAAEKKDDKKEEKCAGKLEPDCTKAPECKWEGKECKDSFILVNKKLVLSMATAFVCLVPF